MPWLKRFLPEVIEVRFWAKVNKNICIGHECGCHKGLGCCWIWTASKNNKGYGQIRINTRLYLATRVIFALDNKIPIQELPSKLEICHHCDVPACVRHLFSGSHKDNQQDSIRKGRFAFRPKGWSVGEKHPLAKLTEDDVRLIRSLRWVETQKALAIRFGCSQPTINNIQHGNIWKHVV